MIEKLLDVFGRFQRVFWTVQTFELLERAAYYTMMPIIAWHAIRNLGIDESLALTITVFMYPFQYGLPIFTGALAEKVGYRKQMIFAFIFLTFAYMFLSFATDPMSLILGVMFIGLGIGSYKPLVSATVAKCTTQKDRNIAYSIYYWVVNLAAGIFPLVWTIILAVGYIDESMYSWVFRIGALFFIINILTAIFIFEEVPRSGQVKTVQDAVDNIKIAMKDKKFVVMVILIGGFWALYSTMLLILPTVILGFKLGPTWLTAMAIGVFNPITIIIVGIPLSKFVERAESLRAVMGGLLIHIIGIMIIGLSLQWFVMILGIIVASIGEFIVAPGYMAFISKLAPKEKVSAYVGCNFISYMIGLFGGTLTFGLLASYLAFDLGRPAFTYGIFMAFGFGLLFAFIVYYKTWGQEIIERAKKIKELEEGVEEKPKTPSTYKEPFMFRMFDYKATPIVSVILIPIVLFATFNLGTMVYVNPYKGEEEIPQPILEVTTLESTETGYTNEFQTSDVTFNIPEDHFRLLWVNCTLTWQDEQSQYFQGTNEPDEFRVLIIAPNEETVAESTLSTAQPISVSARLNYTDENFEVNYLGDWTIRVEAGNCGDDSAFLPILGLRVTEDTGNDWTLGYSYTYLAEVEEPQ